MCTAISFTSEPRVYGRNLDLDRRYGESIVCQPRGFSFPFRYARQRGRAALFGCAAVVRGVPLFYDALNEHGVYMAGLNFPKSASYSVARGRRDDLAPYELIPYLLSACESAREACREAARLNLVGEDFSPELPAARLHFFIADKSDCFAIEPTCGRLTVKEDPALVLTNEPALELHLKGLYGAVPEFSHGGISQYPKISADPSSEARFIRAAVTARLASHGADEVGAISQLFHTLASVSVTEGTAKDSKNHKTVYTSVASPDSNSYHYSTYDDPSVRSVCFSENDFSSSELISHKMIF